MKYFITGGDGFIGYHLTKILIDRGDEVVSYDAQKHYIPQTKSMWPFYVGYRASQLETKKIIRINGDCNDMRLLKKCLEVHRPDYVVHLAALPIASVSNKYPAEAKLNILDSTKNLLDSIRSLNFSIKKFTYISSSMVYGDFLRDRKGDIVAATEDQPCNPLGTYGAMKLAGEVITKTYNEKFGLPYTIVRPSAVYGPTDSNRRVVEIFLNNALEGKPLVLDNGGIHFLDFTYVKDLAVGLVKVLDSKNSIGETFNITRGQGRSIAEMAQIIKEIIPETKIISKERKVYRPNRGSLDITKAKKVLGYNPIYSLEQGISDYYSFIKNM